MKFNITPIRTRDKGRTSWQQSYSPFGEKDLGKRGDSYILKSSQNKEIRGFSMRGEMLLKKSKERKKKCSQSMLNILEGINFQRRGLIENRYPEISDEGYTPFTPKTTMILVQKEAGQGKKKTYRGSRPEASQERAGVVWEKLP